MLDNAHRTDPAQALHAAQSLHRAGRMAEAERAYAAALERAPENAAALHGLGVLNLQTGRADAAVSLLQKAVAASRGAHAVRNDLGVALCTSGRLSEAAELYRALCAEDPGAVTPAYALGQILNRLGAHADAAAALKRALDLAPDDGRIHHQLAIALAETRDETGARAHFEAASARLPDRDDILCDYGEFLLRADRPQQAAACYARVLARTANAPAALCGLGEAMGRTNRHEEAVALFRRAISAAPDFALAHYNCGTALAYLGHLDEAEAAFRRALAIEPDHPAYRGALVAMGKADTPDEREKLEALAAGGSLNAREAMELQFTLARAYETAGDAARAFAALARGNKAKRALDPYDPYTDLTRLADLAGVFTRARMTALDEAGDPAETPVFIVGMPRSGTTLVEQILASHPDVYGAGELAILPELVAGGRAGADFPAGAAELGAEDWRALGAAYVTRLRMLPPPEAHPLRITDKLPLNFQLLGPIALALPRAKIVHVRRDPLDTCFSCYATLFAGELGFTYDLADLGRYYRGYETLMAHWRAVLPEGRMLELSYEALVADFATEAKRLVAFCGLDWHPACLDFHRTVRPVETASALQVRKPLFKTSVGRASPFRPWLGPLIAALGEGAAE